MHSGRNDAERAGVEPCHLLSVQAIAQAHIEIEEKGPD